MRQIGRDALSTATLSSPHQVLSKLLLHVQATVILSLSDQPEKLFKVMKSFWIGEPQCTYL